MNSELARKLIGVIRPLADIPFQDFDRSRLAEDTYPIMAWNGHPITVADIKNARLMIEVLTPYTNP